jgi:streptogramin lyase
LNGVSGLAVDPAGNLYVTEFNNGQVDEVSPAGVVTPLTTGANAPYAVALDQSGNVYYSDWFTNSIYEIVRTTPPSLSFATTLQGHGKHRQPARRQPAEHRQRRAQLLGNRLSRGFPGRQLRRN